MREEVRLEVVRERAVVDFEVGVFGFAVLVLCVDVVFVDVGAVSGNAKQASSRIPAKAHARKRCELKRLIRLSVLLPASTPKGALKSATTAPLKRCPDTNLRRGDPLRALAAVTRCEPSLRCLDTNPYFGDPIRTRKFQTGFVMIRAVPRPVSRTKNASQELSKKTSPSGTDTEIIPDPGSQCQ